MKILPLILLLVLSPISSSAQPGFDLQGHRGCRGLMPENSIPAFLKAIDLEVNTLEMDVVITRDRQVLISHDHYISHVFCFDPQGRSFDKTLEQEYRIYDLPLSDVQQFDCGSKPHPGFPEQEKINTCKPSLREAFHAIEDYLAENALPLVMYNIETKCSPEGDDILHPAPEPFVDLLMEVINESGLADRVTIQSFDVRTLQYLHKEYPEIPTALLVANLKSFRKNLGILGFIPDIYSPNHLLIKPGLVKKVHGKGMRLIPWTVNKEKDIQKMMEYGVDGLITDYPDRVRKQD